MSIRIRFEDYEPMVRHRSFAWSKMTGIDIKEFESLGRYLFAKIIGENSYDPNKGSFSTYFYQTLNGNFLHFSKVYKKAFPPIEDPDQIPQNSPSQEDLVIFADILSNLSSDAKEVCQIVFETPSDLLSMIIHGSGHKRVSRANLETYFHDQKGWKYNRFRNCVQEIKLALGIEK